MAPAGSPAAAAAAVAGLPVTAPPAAAGPSVRTPRPDPGATSAAPVSTAATNRAHTAAVAIADGPAPDVRLMSLSVLTPSTVRGSDRVHMTYVTAPGY